MGRIEFQGLLLTVSTIDTAIIEYRRMKALRELKEKSDRRSKEKEERRCKEERLKGKGTRTGTPLFGLSVEMTETLWPERGGRVASKTDTVIKPPSSSSLLSSSSSSSSSSSFYSSSSSSASSSSSTLHPTVYTISDSPTYPELQTPELIRLVTQTSQDGSSLLVWAAEEGLAEMAGERM